MLNTEKPAVPRVPAEPHEQVAGEVFTLEGCEPLPSSGTLDRSRLRVGAREIDTPTLRSRLEQGVSLMRILQRSLERGARFDWIVKAAGRIDRTLAPDAEDCLDALGKSELREILDEADTWCKVLADARPRELNQHHLLSLRESLISAFNISFISRHIEACCYTVLGSRNRVEQRAREHLARFLPSEARRLNDLNPFRFSDYPLEEMELDLDRFAQSIWLANDGRRSVRAEILAAAVVSALPESCALTLNVRAGQGLLRVCLSSAVSEGDPIYDYEVADLDKFIAETSRVAQFIEALAGAGYDPHTLVWTLDLRRARFMLPWVERIDASTRQQLIDAPTEVTPLLRGSERQLNQAEIDRLGRHFINAECLWTYAGFVLEAAFPSDWKERQKLWAGTIDRYVHEGAAGLRRLAKEFADVVEQDVRRDGIDTSAKEAAAILGYHLEDRRSCGIGPGQNLLRTYAGEIHSHVMDQLAEQDKRRTLPS